MLSPILACWVTATLTAPQARIHAPLVPMLAVVAGRSIAERQWRFVLKPAGVSLKVVVFWVIIAVLAAYWAWEIFEGVTETFGLHP